MKKCTVIWPNVWTSAGKRFADDVVELPEAEADSLKELGAVKVARARKAEKSDAE